MKNRFLLIALALSASTAALAQAPAPAPAAASPAAPAPKFQPIVLDEATTNQLTAYLSGLPYSQAAPIINLLAKLEGDAQAAAPKK